MISDPREAIRVACLAQGMIDKNEVFLVENSGGKGKVRSKVDITVTEKEEGYEKSVS